MRSWFKLRKRKEEARLGQIQRLITETHAGQVALLQRFLLAESRTDP
jgi:hypothetical protein